MTGAISQTLLMFRLNAPVVVRVIRVDDNLSIQSKHWQTYFPSSSW